MNNKGSIKKRLLPAIFALVLCLSLFVGLATTGYAEGDLSLGTGSQSDVTSEPTVLSTTSELDANEASTSTPGSDAPESAPESTEPSSTPESVPGNSEPASAPTGEPADAPTGDPEEPDADEMTTEMFEVSFYSRDNALLATLEVEADAVIAPEQVPAVDETGFIGWYSKDTAQAIAAAWQAYQSGESGAAPDLAEFGDAVDLTAPITADAELMAAYRPVASRTRMMRTLSAACGTEEELAAALANPAITIIELTDDIDLESALEITGTRELTFVSPTTERRTIYATNSRHFLTSGPVSLSFNNVGLYGAGTGGGIESRTGLLQLTGALLQLCRTTGNGGGVYAAGGVILTDCVVTNGIADNNGGGVYSESVLMLNGTSATDNIALNHGGGVYSTGYAELVNTTLSGNTAYNNGGGVYAKAALTTLNAIISGNTAGATGISGGNSQGGGAFVFGGNVSMTGGSLAENTAVVGNGGGIWVDQGNATFTGVDMRGNSSKMNGGAVFAANANGTAGVVTLAAGTTVNNNTAPAGGDNAAVFTRGSVVLSGTGVTVSGNTAGSAILSKNGIVANDGSTVASDTPGMVFSANSGTVLNAADNISVTGNVTFSGNKKVAATGGNKTVTFRGNVIVRDHTTGTLITGGTLDVQGGKLTNNSGAGNGVFQGNSFHAANCEISYNVYSGFASVAFLEGPVSSLTNCQVVGNRNNSGDAGSGGAAFYVRNNHTMTATGCVFKDNINTQNGIFRIWGNLIVDDCTFEGNQSGSSGAAFTSFNSASPDARTTVTNSRFINNTSGYWGGAIYSSRNTSIIGCTFTGNSVTQAANNTQGGALYSYLYAGNEFVLTDTTFTGNHAAPGWGGAVSLGGVSNFTITGCEFTGNSAADAGAILLNTKTADAVKNLITDTTFTDNTTPGNGGALEVYGPLQVTGSSFSGNTAAGHGGAIWMSGLSRLATNGVTFSGNAAGAGHYWDYNNPPNHQTLADKSIHAANILATSYTAPYNNAYNNFDVNYEVGEAGFPVTLEYYIDNVTDPADADHYIGQMVIALQGPVTEATIAAALPGWDTWNQPAGYPAATARPALTGSVVANGSADITVTLLYSYSHTVTFNGNGADVEATPRVMTVEAPANKLAALPAPPTRVGYVFNGWNTQANGSGKAFTASTAVAGDITVYAQWLANYYSLTFNLNGGNSNPPTTQSLRVKQLAQAVSAPTNPGHTFLGWNTQQDGSGSWWDFAASTMPANNLTLYAQWQEVVVPTPPVTPPEAGSSSSSSSSTSRSTSASSSSSTSSSSTSTVAGGVISNSPNTPPSAPSAASVITTPAATGTTPETGSEQERMENQSGNPLVDIMNGNVPLGSFGQNSAWSILNLLLSLMCLFICLVIAGKGLLGRISRQRDEYEDGEEAKPRSIRSVLMGIVTIVMGLMPGLFFLILEDLSKPMVWVNSITAIICILAAVHMLLLGALVVIRRHRRYENDEHGDTEEMAGAY